MATYLGVTTTEIDWHNYGKKCADCVCILYYAHSKTMNYLPTVSILDEIMPEETMEKCQAVNSSSKCG